MKIPIISRHNFPSKRQVALLATKQGSGCVNITGPTEVGTQQRRDGRTLQRGTQRCRQDQKGLGQRGEVAVKLLSPLDAQKEPVPSSKGAELVPESPISPARPCPCVWGRMLAEGAVAGELSSLAGLDLRGLFQPEWFCG